MRHLFAAAILAAIPVFGQAATLDANFESSTNQGAQVGLTYSNLAQSFTIENDGTLESIELKMSKFANDVVGPAIVDLYAFAASIGASLGSSSAAAADVPNGVAYDWVVFDFSGLNLAVSAGDTFAVGLYDGGSTENNQYVWNAGVNDSNGSFATYLGGQRYSSGDDGATWGGVPSWDMSFRVNLDPSVVPVPASLPLLVAGLGAFGLMRRRKSS